jgi:hypothetical protein
MFITGMLILSVCATVHAQTHAVDPVTDDVVLKTAKGEDLHPVSGEIPEVNEMRGHAAHGFGTPMAMEISKDMEFPLPQPYALKELYARINERCASKDFDCYRSGLIDITKIHGARAGLDLLRRLIDNDDIQDYGMHHVSHHVAHHIGFYNAVTFGASRETLFLCAMDFKYACVHGFFQGAIRTKQMDPQAARKFVDDLAGDPSTELLLRYALYHGLGHGYMVYFDYDMRKAIGLCDQLNDDGEKISCWGGLFMENEDCSLTENWQKCGYSREDPMAPCNSLPSVNQYTCYFNHSRWLMDLFDNDFVKVIEACGNVPEGRGIGCLEYLGQTVMNLNWQKHFIKDYSSRSIPGNAVYVCEQFPGRLTETCMRSTIFGFRNDKKNKNIGLDDFCQGLDPQYQQWCLSPLGEGEGDKGGFRR